jgi:hypothetical protein
MTVGFTLKMTLSQAQFIAGHPDLSIFTREEITEALARLQAPNVVARMRNVRNERTIERWRDRLARLQDELETIANQDEARKL